MRVIKIHFGTRESGRAGRAARRARRPSGPCWARLGATVNRRPPRFKAARPGHSRGPRASGAPGGLAQARPVSRSTGKGPVPAASRAGRRRARNASGLHRRRIDGLPAVARPPWPACTYRRSDDGGGWMDFASSNRRRVERCRHRQHPVGKRGKGRPAPLEGSNVEVWCVLAMRSSHLLTPTATPPHPTGTCRLPRT